MVKTVAKKLKKAKYPDYERFDTDDKVTFGTSVFIRKDGRALMIIFPAGDILHFKPENEIKGESETKEM